MNDNPSDAINETLIELGNVTANLLGDSQLELEIKTKKTSRFARVILLGMGTFCFFVPVLATIYIIGIGIELGFGIVISFLLFWGTSFFFMRLFLWNKYGRQIVKIEKQRISSLVDYKWFKDNAQETNFEELKIKYSYVESYNKGEQAMCWLKFITNEQTLSSSIPIRRKDCAQLSEIIDEFVGK